MISFEASDSEFKFSLYNLTHLSNEIRHIFNPMTPGMKKQSLQ